MTVSNKKIGLTLDSILATSLKSINTFSTNHNHNFFSPPLLNLQKHWVEINKKKKLHRTSAIKYSSCLKMSKLKTGKNLLSEINEPSIMNMRERERERERERKGGKGGERKSYKSIYCMGLNVKMVLITSNVQPA